MIHPNWMLRVFSFSSNIYQTLRPLRTQGQYKTAQQRSPAGPPNGNAEPTIESLSISRSSSHKLFQLLQLRNLAFQILLESLLRASICQVFLTMLTVESCNFFGCTKIRMSQTQNVSNPNSKPKNQDVKPKTQNKDTLFAPTFNWMDFQEVTLSY